jgi:hypothetical protein
LVVLKCVTLLKNREPYFFEIRDDRTMLITVSLRKCYGSLDCCVSIFCSSLVEILLLFDVIGSIS